MKRAWAILSIVGASFLLNTTRASAQGTYCDGYKDGWGKAVATAAVKPPYRGCPGERAGAGTAYDRGFEVGYAAGKAAR